MQPKFSADEKVLCYHGPLLYEAKILKNKKEGGSYNYFVHYQGWNRNWDEWVAESRIMKQVAENFDKQKKLLATHMAQTKAKKKAQKAEKGKKGRGGSDSGSNSRASTPVSDRQAGGPLPPPGGSAVGGTRQHQAGKRGAAEEEQTSFSKEAETEGLTSPNLTTPVSIKEAVGASTRKKARKEELHEDVNDILSDDVTDNKYCIDIPEELKHILVNDWDLVVHQKMLFKLPAKVTVNNILEQYLDHLKRQQDVEAPKKGVAQEVIKGVGEYFNVSLGSQLLYSVEKQQYKEDCESVGAVQPSDVYGSAHLLRLMVKIGGYLSFSNFSDQSSKMIEDQIDDFLSYLDMNRSMFFSSKNYMSASK